MINEKYYNDIKQFPTQFRKGFELAQGINLSREFTKVIICGMGGSSLYTELLNDYLLSINSNLVLNVARSYSVPSYVDDQTLVITASHSGNTEESISCLTEVMQKNLNVCVFASGGKLKQMAEENNIPLFLMPGGGQPRLATGYFVAGVIALLIKYNLISDVQEEVLGIAENMPNLLEEELAKQTAMEIKGKVPVIYATDNNSSLARISKIKFNENTKTQAFWNFFPELNHNEMVGFTNLVMNPYFIIYSSKFTNPRNHKRIQIFSRIMQDKGLGLKVLELKGNSVLEEILFGYFWIDHVTYYLSENYGVDPEPVELVEGFKKMLEE